MIKEIKSKDQIVDEILSTIQYHFKEIEGLKSMLPEGVSLPSNIQPNGVALPEAKIKRKYTKKAVASKPKKWKKHKMVFDNVIKDILKDVDVPMLTRSLMDEYEKRTGNVYDRKDFSSRLSIAQKNKGEIKNIKFDQNPNDSKFWWGLSVWFAPNGTLKQQYLDKIKDQIVI